MRVFAPAAFRYPPGALGIDYPYGWQDLPQSLADTLINAGYLASEKPAGGDLKPGEAYLKIKTSSDGGVGSLDAVAVGNAVIPVGVGLPEQPEKLIWRVSGTEARIYTRPAAGNPILWGLSYNNIGSPSNSVGGQSQFWRLVKIIELLDGVVYDKAAYTAAGSAWTQSGTWSDANTVNMRPGTAAGGQVMSIPRTGTAGGYREYSVTVPASGRVGFAFATTATSAGSVTLTCGAATVTVDPRKTVETAGAELSVVWLTGATPGAGTLRVTHSGANGAYMYVLGPVITQLGMMMPAAIPAGAVAGVCTVHNAAGRVIDQAGATEMALFDADISKWCGSYHGGQTGGAIWSFDGVPTDVSSAGSVWLARDVRIRQSTDINGKLACESLHQFRSSAEFIAQIAVSGAMTVSSAYMAMGTTREEWSEVNGVIYPADSAIYTLPPTARVEQRIPGASRRLVISQYDCTINGIPQTPLCNMQIVPGSYAKPRLGFSDGSVVALNTGRWTVSHKLVQPAFAP